MHTRWRFQALRTAPDDPKTELECNFSHRMRDPGARQKSQLSYALVLGLVREAEDRLRQLGCTKVNLQVRASNEEVIAFYRTLGYEIEPRVSMGRRLEEGD